MHLDQLLHNSNNVYFFHDDENTTNMMEEIENHGVKSEFARMRGWKSDRGVH